MYLHRRLGIILPCVTVLQVILWIIVLFYITAPAVIWLTTRHQCYGACRIVAPSQMPDAARDALHSARRELSDLGFEFETYLAISGAPNVMLYLASWRHRQRGQSAALCMVIAGSLRPQRFVQIETIELDPLIRLVPTNQRSYSGVFDRVPGHHANYYPWVVSVSELYRVHLWRERQSIDPHAARYLPRGDDVVEAQASENRFILKEQARQGLYYETKQAGVYRPTLYDSFLMTMRLLPPGKQLRLWEFRRRARAEWNCAIDDVIAPPDLVRVTEESPFEPRLSGDRLSYG
jgi:hypothetical protein